MSTVRFVPLKSMVLFWPFWPLSQIFRLNLTSLNLLIWGQNYWIVSSPYYSIYKEIFSIFLNRKHFCLLQTDPTNLALSKVNTFCTCLERNIRDRQNCCCCCCCFEAWQMWHSSKVTMWPLRTLRPKGTLTAHYDQRPQHFRHNKVLFAVKCHHSLSWG